MLEIVLYQGFENPFLIKPLFSNFIPYSCKVKFKVEKKISVLIKFISAHSKADFITNKLVKQSLRVTVCSEKTDLLNAMRT